MRLATLLNDFNPAHYDLDFATEIGMPGVIGPGTLLQGWILSDIESAIEIPNAATAIPHAVREIDLRFRAPFLVGDTVTIELRGRRRRDPRRGACRERRDRHARGGHRDRAARNAGERRMTGARLPLRRLVAELGDALGQPPTAVLGVPVAHRPAIGGSGTGSS